MLRMYVTTMPVIVAGIMSVIFTKTSVYRRYAKPIDGFYCLRDGRRVFGDNKTWIGFFAMIIFCAVCNLVYGYLLHSFDLSYMSDLYNCHDNTLFFNLVVGFLFGLLYVLLELPNSFMKRRFDIEPGKTMLKGVGYFFLVYDQIDSLIGVMFVIYAVSNISFAKYLGYVALGGFTHILLNSLLYLLKLRRNV